MDFDFEGVFDADYLHFCSAYLTPEANSAQVDRIVSLLDLQPAQRVLDVPCGHGRIANELALRGFGVRGLDASAYFLEQARKDAREKGVEVEYALGDMRALPWENGSFEVLINWFTSFGYFEEAENKALLREFRRVLKPGGTLLLDHLNRERVLATFQRSSVQFHEGDFLIDQPTFDLPTGVIRNERTIVRGGQSRKTVYSVRLFAASEIKAWLEEAGFTSVRITDPDGEPFTTASRRMVCRAQA
jgi:ubiquinone/menaquinone biosynthesis C-methylase UbiE